MRRSEFAKQKGAGTKRAFKRIVEREDPPGLLAYAGKNAIGWCAIAPRESYPVLENSRVLKRVDDQPVWSVVCFFIARNFRRQGVSVEILRAAVQYAKRRGASIVEGYPVEPRAAHVPAVSAYPGTPVAFLKAGFSVVLLRSDTRPIMRILLKNK